MINERSTMSESPYPAGGSPAPNEANKAIVRRYLEEVYGRGNLAAFDELVAPDFVDRTV
jgi:hypothetical protein